MAKFIVYACPLGELADQIERYFEKSRDRYGPNTAHAYMPHCTLTGFFEEVSSAMPNYVQRLDRAYRLLGRSRPETVIEIKALTLRPDWHGLELDSPWLKKLMRTFACTATSPTRKDPLRLKDWLHLSLAYGFSPEQGDALADLARQQVDPTAPVAWELRFYQHNADQAWICHRCWPLCVQSGIQAN
jgi:hypothetical protein